MNILHITSITHPNGNGVAVAVNDYIKYEVEQVNVALYNLESDLDNTYCTNYNYKDYKKIADLPEPFCNPDLVIFNEVYKPKYIELYKECLNKKIKYIIIPHGCLVKYSQKKHKLKKFVGNTLLFNKFIYNANAIQFLNETELDNSSKFKFKKAIIAGNGIDNENIKKNKFKNKNFVYIGRYSIYIKGLDLLVKICKKHGDWFRKNKIKFFLYGRDSSNSLEELKNMINSSKSDDIIIINDAVYGKEKEKILLDSYAFIQLSRHEGQPMGIIESLAYGVPCIVTYGTSFGEYINNKECGFGCNFDSNEIFNAIKKLADDVELRNSFSENAFTNSNEDFNWKFVISDTLKKYKEL